MDGLKSISVVEGAVRVEIAEAVGAEGVVVDEGANGADE